jgi:alcohol dehydrogenase
VTDDLKRLTNNWNYPTAIRFGVGRIAELGDACKAAGISRPLLVTDPGLAGSAMVKDALAATGAALFSDIKPNPVGRNVSDGVAAYRAHKADGVIAFGGGSALDAGKAIAFMSGQTRPLWDFEDVRDWSTRADPKGIAPVVAVPTTAGTGSEVGRASVITNEATHTKKIIFHPKMLPVVVILDPALTVGLPAKLTAATGMDALAHNLEAYCSPHHHPLAAGIALEGMRLVKEYLPRATRNGADLEARAHMLASAAMGATAFQKGLGAIHSLSHPVGAVYDSHHGLCNAVFMPYVLAFNRPAIEERMIRLARYLGLADASTEGVIDWVLALRKELAIPHTADAIGVKTADLDMLSAMAAEDPSCGGNPVPLDAKSLKRLYEVSLAG